MSFCIETSEMLSYKTCKILQQKWNVKAVGETHIKAVKEIISRFLVLHEELQILKNLRRQDQKNGIKRLKSSQTLTSKISNYSNWVFCKFVQTTDKYPIHFGALLWGSVSTRSPMRALKTRNTAMVR